MKARKPPEHNYVRKLRYLIKTGAFPRTVGLHQVSVYHNDWCGIFQRQYCNCDPNFRLKWSQPAIAEN